MTATSAPRAVVSLPALDQPGDQCDDLVVGHLVAHVVGGHQVADQIVLRSLLALECHFAHPGRHLDHGLLTLTCHLLRGEGQRIGDDRLGQTAEPDFVAHRRRVCP